MPVPDADAIVEAYNELGYAAPFAAVARKLKIAPDALYIRYPSREALAEAWLANVVPKAAPPGELGEAFAHVVLRILRTMEQRRDFARAWVVALVGTAPLQPERFKNLHEYLYGYFISWLDANEKSLGLPPNVFYADVRVDLADLLCMMASGFVVSWEADRSLGYGQTRRRVEAMRYLLDALLIQRQQFGDTSLLTHLYTLLESMHAQHLRPALELLLNPERLTRFASPSKLGEALRMFLPPSS
jgi:AcrR family transcriptional regulator